LSVSDKAGGLLLTVTVSASLAELLAVAASATPFGALIVATLVSVPDAAADIEQVAVKVALPPLSRLTELLMLPEPEAGQELPDDAAQVQVQVSDDGNVSATIAPVTLLGPRFPATSV
jgi:hypothetical protein